MNELHIDKTHWKRTKIGDLLYKTEYNDKENASKQYSKFIKMEHLDANSLNIHRCGDSSVEDIPPTFYKIFKKGQILYPTRNPQLRRAALASFDGICGEKTLTLSLIEGCEGYIPFIAHVFHSSAFIEYATNARIGSTNPHIRWRDVADYEFLLPPKAEQKRLAELLWAADEVVEKEKREREKVEELYNYQIENLFVGEKVLFGKCANINEKTLGAKTPNDYMFHYIDIASIVSPKHLGPLTKYSFADAPSRARRIVKQNDIVLSLVRPYLKSFVQIKSNQNNLIASTGTAVVSAKSENSTDFLFHMLFSKAFMAFCENRMNGTNYPAITPADLADFQIPSYNYDEQLSIADKLNTIDNTIKQLECQIIKSQEVKQEIINIIF